MSKNSPDFNPDGGFPIVVDDLHVAAGREQILSGVSAVFEPGEFVAITGESGSGKTTLASTILGLAGRPRRWGRASSGLQVQSGTVRYGDLDIYDGLSVDDRARLRGNHIGYVPQRPNFRPGQTVQDAVTLPHRLMGADPSTRFIRHYAEVMDIGGQLGKRVETLSGGQQQRANILRGLVGDPDVVVLDEPTSDLNTERKAETNDLLLELSRAMGKTLIVITHEETSATRRLHLRDGMLEDGGLVEVGHD